jgi:hypothetical protein
MQNKERWNLELETKPDFEKAMERVYAWYEQEMIDRPPIRFTAHNAEFSIPKKLKDRSWPDLKSRWFDVEYQVEFFAHSLVGQEFLAETFPVFWPNLGPEVFAAFYGAELIYQEVTSYSVPMVKEWGDLEKLKLDMHNEYFRTIEELTQAALEQCKNQFMVGYTDLHPGIDCVAAWRDPQQLCLDILLEPERIKETLEIANKEYQLVFDHFDSMLKEQDQLSVTWMGIPSFGKMHIPSCDVAAMISKDQFDEFVLPTLQQEVKPMSHNIFHADGKGVGKNIDRILEINEINAIQWVQGEGVDRPILQWVPFIKKCQEKGKSVVVDLHLNELEEFISRMDPRGLYLCIAASQDIQKDIIKRVEKW